MKKTQKLKKIVVFSLLIISALCLTACEMPWDGISAEKTVSKFLNAFPEGDIDTITSCELPLAQKQSNAGKSAANTMCSLGGISLDNDTLEALGGTFLAWIFNGIEFNVTGSEVNGDTAKVYFDMTRNGKPYMSDQYIYASKYQRKWYVDWNQYAQDLQ